jgi:DNA-binding NtrC family response regulator
MPHALVVDDDPDSAASLRSLIAGERFTVAVAQTLRDARRQISLQPPDVLLLDLRLPDGNGMDLLADPELVSNAEVVLCTGHASIESSVQALRLGAADYLIKPVNLKQLQGVLSRVMKPAALQAEVAGWTAQVQSQGHFGRLWGRSEVMQHVYEQISRVAVTSVTVLITGQSGTGKEMVAQTVHDLSRRRKRPFLAVNCGAISPNLIESEIFGHEKGSFTGAERQHQGFFERAAGGTLFLDEITEMPLELQVKLLRVLETGRFTRVGSTDSQETDVRIIAATNRVPLQAVAQGKLREDLFYRLDVFPIELPPLRARLADVGLLAEHFLEQISEQEGVRRRLTAAALKRLQSHAWPGNVRELRNALQRAYVMAQGAVVDERWLPDPAVVRPELAVPAPVAPAAVAAAAPAPAEGAAAHVGNGAAPPADCVMLPIGTSMAQAERTLTLATLRHYNHHKERTAAVLGISLKTLYNRLKEYAVDGGGSAPPAPPRA